MAAAGDDRVQVEETLQAAVAISAAVDRQTRIAESPGYRVAYVKTDRVLPGHPIQDASAGIQRQDAGAMDVVASSGFRQHGFLRSRWVLLSSKEHRPFSASQATTHPLQM